MNVGGDVEVHYKVNFYYPFTDHVIQHLNGRFPEEIKRVLQASFLIPAKLQLLDETVVARIEQSLGDELPNKAEFAQEVKKLNPQFMSLSEQFQNSDSFICIKGMYFFSTATALEDEERQLRC